MKKCLHCNHNIADFSKNQTRKYCNPRHAYLYKKNKTKKLKQKHYEIKKNDTNFTRVSSNDLGI